MSLPPSADTTTGSAVSACPTKSSQPHEGAAEPRVTGLRGTLEGQGANFGERPFHALERIRARGRAGAMSGPGPSHLLSLSPSATRRLGGSSERGPVWWPYSIARATSWQPWV